MNPERDCGPTQTENCSTCHDRRFLATGMYQYPCPDCTDMDCSLGDAENECQECQECEDGFVYGPEWEDWDRRTKMPCDICGGTGRSRTDNVECPDGGRCHHQCSPSSCFRVQRCGPLSGVYPNDEWPADVAAENVDGLAPHDEHDGDDDGCDGDDPDGVHTVVLPTGPSS